MLFNIDCTNMFFYYKKQIYTKKIYLKYCIKFNEEPHVFRFQAKAPHSSNGYFLNHSDFYGDPKNFAL